MDPKPTTEQIVVHAEERRSDDWFATFSFLDVGSAISASQLRRLLATVSKQIGSLGTDVARSKR